MIKIQTTQYLRRYLLLEIVMILVGLIFLAPFYFVFANSIKPFGEILKNAASFPQEIYYENYVEAWRVVNFPRVLLNSLLITACSIGGMVLMGAMMAWRMVRRPHVISRLFYVLFVAAMIIPFQSVMIPMVKVATVFHLVNSIPGVIIIYFSFGMPLTVFLLHGFVKIIPRELEESGYIDGCSASQIFFHIVFPLMQTMLVTVTILQTLWIWNDFLLPLLILFREPLQTIPLGIFKFFGQYLDQWGAALATLTMGMIPIVIFFLLLQRYIIRGITAGSVKG